VSSRQRDDEPARGIVTAAELRFKQTTEHLLPVAIVGLALAVYSSTRYRAFPARRLGPR